MAHIANVVIPSRNVPAAVRFYRDALGLATTAEGNAWCFLDGGGVTVAIHAEGTDPAFAATGRGIYLDVAVDSLDEAEARLEAAGVGVMKAWADHNGRFVLVEDPDGNRVEVFEPASA